MKSDLFRRTWVLGFAVLLAACGGGGDGSSADDGHVVASFLAPQNDMLEADPSPNRGPAFPEFKEQTLRQIAHLSVGGKAIKVKFSNQFGTTPLTLDKVRVARSLGTGTIDPATDRALTFSGKESVTIPPGEELYSDVVAFPLPALSDVAVSIYMKQATVRTAQRVSTTMAYIGSGDFASAAALPSPFTSTSTFYMPEVDVVRDTPVNVVVALGDSTTAGGSAQRDAFNSWPNQLAEIANAKFDVAVLNAGIGGNRMVKDVDGPCGLCRLDRDVLNVPGVTHVIMLLGINDIGNGYNYANLQKNGSQLVTSAQITANIQAAIDKLKAKGIKVYVSPLMPFKGAAYYTSGQPGEVPFGATQPYNGEQMRQEVNAFIRANKTVDGIIDFDKAIQSTADPLMINPVWSSGDNLHPNDAGYAVMAKAVPLSALR